MKVLYVYTHTALGGGEVLLLRILKGVDRARIDPFVVISRRNIRLANVLKEAEIPFITLPDINILSENKLLKACIQLPNFLWLNLLMGGIIIRHRPRIVHAGLFYSALFSVIPAKILGRRFMWAALTPTDLIRYPIASKFLMRLADRTMLPCADFIRIAKEHAMPGIEKMKVIYTGMRDDEFQTRPSQSGFSVMGHYIKRPIVALIARYDEEQKGHIYFWEMAEKIHHTFPMVNFIILGRPYNDKEERFKKRLDLLTQEKSLSQNLFCIDSVDTIFDFLAAVDIVVIPSVYEAPSAVAQEAGAAAKPVVAFKVGGIPEVVRDGEGGFLVPFPDVSALTEKVKLLLSDPALAKTMGEKGKAFVKERFREEGFIRAYEEVYAVLMV